MDPDFRRMVVERDEAAFEQAFFDGACPHVFLVDWREEDEEIVALCSKALGLEDLAAVWRDDELYVTYGILDVRVPLKMEEGDRHTTVCTLNDVLSPGHQIRFVVISHGGDTLGFVALSSAEWKELEKANAGAVAENFVDPRKLPNLITVLNEHWLPAKARMRWERLQQRSEG